MTDDDLTSSERRALEELPRERTPGDFLEERVVRSLHQRGLLRARRRRALELTPFRLAAAVAASLLLIAAGFAAGRWTSFSRTAEPTAPARQAHDLAVTASLQQAASAYMGALDEFEASLHSVGSEQARQGREVALATLYSTADRVARVVPADRLTDRIRTAIDLSAADAESDSGEEPRRRVIEF